MHLSVSEKLVSLSRTGGRKQTNSAMNITSSSELLIKRSSRPGIIWRSFIKTRCSFRSLTIINQVRIQPQDDVTHSAVKLSSGVSASSTIRSKPFVSKACTLVMAWTVQPKWRPWWTKGSEMHLESVFKKVRARKMRYLRFFS
jgi:hypothetical protein